MAHREALIRELLLTDTLTLRVPDPDRQTRRVLTRIHDGAETHLTYDHETKALSFQPATAAEADLGAAEWHNLIAAARMVLLTLEKVGQPLTERILNSQLAPAGFTPAHVRAAVNLLRGEKLVSRTEGTITDLSGTDGRRARRLSPASLSPAPSPAPSTAPVNRPNMRMDVAPTPSAPIPRMNMPVSPTAGFDPGELTAAPVKKVAEKAPIPDSATIAQHAEVLDMWARHGKPTATWGELPWRNIPLELPEGVTRNDVVQEVFDRLTAKGTVKISADGDTFTYAPAADAVAAVRRAHLEMSSHVTNAMASGVFRGALGGITPPMGWDISTLHKLAMDALVADGTLVIEDGLYRNTKAKAPVAAPAPKAEPKPVAAPAPVAAKVEPKPVQAARTTEPAPTKPAVPAVAPVPALEKKVDTLTAAVSRVERKLDTMPPPPTAEKLLVADADTDVKRLLESVCVHLKLNGAMREAAIHRALPGKSKPSRSNPDPIDRRLRLGEALTLGVDAKILAHDPLTRTYRLVTVTNLMPRAELDRRVQRVLDLRKSRENAA